MCRAKRKKEQFIDEKLSERFEEEFRSLKNAIDKKGGVKRIDKVWERIGRLKEKHKRASPKYQISVSGQEGKATGVTWELKSVPKPKEDKANGAYFICNNHENPTEE